LAYTAGLGYSPPVKTKNTFDYRLLQQTQMLHNPISETM